jgi:hypothetical protein
MSHLPLMFSGQRFWKLHLHPHWSVPFQPSCLGFSPPSLTQQRGDQPECEGLQGDVWELQDLTD